MTEGVTPADRALSRTLRVGAAVWLAAALLQLAIHGISLDENATAGPIIAGAIHYPAGHPHDVFYRTAFSLLQYLAGALWLAWPDAFGISALYNIAFLFMSAFAPFALALVLTERARWAYAAGALALTEAAVPFDGLYPIYVYPFPFSNGHIGMHLIVLVAALLLARRWRTAGFLLGAFPAVHGSLALVAWAWAAWWMLTPAGRPDAAERRRLILSSAGGLAICIALGVAILARGASSPLPPYVSTDDALAVYRQFTMSSDVHRQTPDLTSFGYLVNPLAFFLLGALAIALRRALVGADDTLTRRLRGVLDLGTVAWVLIVGAYLYRHLIGTLPMPLEIAMPFRLVNLTALLLIPITVAAMDSAEEVLDRPRRWAIPLLLVGTLVVGAMYSIRNPPLVAAFILLALWGVITAVVLFTEVSRARVIAAGLLASLVVAFFLTGDGERPFLALFVPFAGTCMVLWLASRFSVLRAWAASLSAPRLERALLGACVLAVLVGIGRRGGDDPDGPVDHTWRRLKPEDRALRAWAASHTAPDELILAPIWPYAKAQAKLGRPQIFEWETMYVMTYAPRNAAVVNQLSRDIYGVDYADARSLSAICGGVFINIWCREWADAWRTRSRAEWEALGRKYAVHRLMAPRDWAIDLPRDTTAGSWSMYHIP